MLKCLRKKCLTHSPSRPWQRAIGLRDRGVDFDDYEWFDNAVDMAFCDHVDIVVELIGGSDGIARELTEAALANGKHVVTANKALIATHGTSLANMAEEAGVNLAFEVAVAGGVPIIKALREGLIANRIDRVYGILNGTCNYILFGHGTVRTRFFGCT